MVKLCLFWVSLKCLVPSVTTQAFEEEAFRKQGVYSDAFIQQFVYPNIMVLRAFIFSNSHLLEWEQESGASYRQDFKKNQFELYRQKSDGREKTMDKNPAALFKIEMFPIYLSLIHLFFHLFIKYLLITITGSRDKKEKIMSLLHLQI